MYKQLSLFSIGGQKFAGLCLLVLCATACSSRSPVSVTEMVNHARCEKTEVGVTIIDFKQMASLRGSRLIGGSLAPVTQIPNTRLAAISKGPQGSAGYRFELDYAYQMGDELVIEVSWFEPPADQAQAQVVTEPCLVVAFPTVTDSGPIRRVRALDVVSDSSIGEALIPAQG